MHPPAPGYRANADLAGKEIFWEEAELKTQPCLLTHPRNLTLKREIFIPSAAVFLGQLLDTDLGCFGAFCSLLAVHPALQGFGSIAFASCE